MLKDGSSTRKDTLSPSIARTLSDYNSATAEGVKSPTPALLFLIPAWNNWARGE
jgi:hypothetical protein